MKNDPFKHLQLEFSTLEWKMVKNIFFSVGGLRRKCRLKRSVIDSVAKDYFAKLCFKVTGEF